MSTVVQGASGLQGVRLLELRQVVEWDRGCLAVGELGRELPFVPRRIFLTYGVPEGTARGEHAHRLCDQILICVHGACRFRVDDGCSSREVVLDAPVKAAVMPRMVWVAERWRSPGAVLLVLASRLYEPEDYIRDYGEFLAMQKAEPGREA